MNHTMRLRVFGTWNYHARSADALAMLRQRAARGLFRIRFRVGNRRQTAADHAPMVEDAGNMSHLFPPELLDAAQRQVVILRAFESFAKPADFAQEIQPID